MIKDVRLGLQTTMKYWISIVGSTLTHKRLSDGTGNHYCMPETCDVGDPIGMYVTRRAFKNAGFFGVYSIEKKDSSKNSECKAYGTPTRKSDCSAYVEVKQLKLLDKPISIEVIKSNTILSNSNFGKKNMLGTYFQASKIEFDEILKLIQQASKI